MNTAEESKKTCLYDRHVALGAHISPFAGFDMPIEYSGIEDEHNAVRNSCGVFDVSHMGEVLVTGAEASRFVNYIFSNDITAIEDGQILYGMLPNHEGGVVDDLLVYRRSADNYFLVINAANIAKDVAWIEEHAKNFDVTVENQSEKYGELAIQGPEAEKVMTEVLDIACGELGFYTFKDTEIDGVKAVVSRTGYTGEDGFEVYTSPEIIVKLWDRLIESGRCAPCGLGCRDTLRFEAGLPLYGNELADDVSPLEATLSMFAKLDKPEMIGLEALKRQKAEGVKRKSVGLELEGNAIARHGYDVLDKSGRKVGTVTTGYRSITLGKSIAMVMVEADSAKIGTELQVQIRRRTFPAVVVKKRFYTPNYKK